MGSRPEFSQPAFNIFLRLARIIQRVQHDDARRGRECPRGHIGNSKKIEIVEYLCRFDRDIAVLRRASGGARIADAQDSLQVRSGRIGRSFQMRIPALRRVTRRPERNTAAQPAPSIACRNPVRIASSTLKLFQPTIQWPCHGTGKTRGNPAPWLASNPHMRRDMTAPKIDAYNHYIPPAYLDLIRQHSKDSGIVKRMTRIRVLWDIEARVELLASGRR